MVVVSLDRKQSLQQAQRNSVTKDPEEGGEGGFVYFSIKNVTKLMCTPPNLHKRRTCNVFSSGAKTKTKKLQQKQTKFPHCGWGEKGGGAHSRLQGLSRSLPARCVHVVLAQSRTQILVCSYCACTRSLWVRDCFGPSLMTSSLIFRPLGEGGGSERTTKSG